MLEDRSSLRSLFMNMFYVIITEKLDQNLSMGNLLMFILMCASRNS